MASWTLAINERPKGRKEINNQNMVARIAVRSCNDLIEAQLAEGRQAYVICVLIDELPQMS